MNAITATIYTNDLRYSDRHAEENVQRIVTSLLERGFVGNY